MNPLHHIEIYVTDLDASLKFWDWLMGELGFDVFNKWNKGISYGFGDYYIVFVQVEDKYLHLGYHRCGPGLNHLAFRVENREKVDSLTKQAKQKEFTVLYPEKHPYAGGDDIYALYLEDPSRMKVEIISDN